MKLESKELTGFYDNNNNPIYDGYRLGIHKVKRYCSKTKKEYDSYMETRTVYRQSDINHRFIYKP